MYSLVLPGAHLVILRLFLALARYFIVVLAFSVGTLTRLKERREPLTVSAQLGTLYLARNNVARNDIAEDVLICGKELQHSLSTETGE
jgi:hypothetical protein